MKRKKILIWTLIFCLTLGLAAGAVYATLHVNQLNKEIEKNVKALPDTNKSYFSLEQAKNQNEMLPYIVSYIHYFNFKKPTFNKELIKHYLPSYYEVLIYKKMNLNPENKNVELKFTYKIINQRELVINLNWRVLQLNQSKHEFLKLYYDYFILRLSY